MPKPSSQGPASAQDSLSKAIGSKVRGNRRQLGFTVAQLAELSDISKGMLSKIENAHVSPSLSTLSRIADALDVPLATFFDDLEPHPVIHVKAGLGLDLIASDLGGGMRSQLLGTLRGSTRRLEPVLYTIKRSAKIGASYRHPGTEFIFLIDGSLEYAHGSRRFSLEEGDSLQFDGEVMHGPVHLVSSPVRLLSVKAYTSGVAPPIH